jgi:hypothetical protein
MKPKLYLPRVAVLPLARNALRPLTYAALRDRSLLVEMEAQGEEKVKDSRHESSGDGLEEESNRNRSAGQEAANATA